MSDNPHDALRRVIEAEANQEDDGGFFAKLYGLTPDEPCHHDWEEVWSAEDHYFHCRNCGRQIKDDAATLNHIAEQYRTEDDQLREIKAQAWQDGHDTALINGQSENPHRKENK